MPPDQKRFLLLAILWLQIFVSLFCLVVVGGDETPGTIIVDNQVVLINNVGPGRPEGLWTNFALRISTLLLVIYGPAYRKLRIFIGM